MTSTHPWNLSPAEAVQLQQRLRSQVRIEPLPGEITRVGGVDVGFGERHCSVRSDEVAHAAVVVLDCPGMRRVESAVAKVPVTFPYIPGLLSFREIPAILAAFEQLATFPDVLMVDGQGVAHPRRFGIASHLGVLLDRPTIGCAKSVLVGHYGSLGEAPGSTAELRDGDEVIGMVLRTRLGSKPLILSVGHRVDLSSALRLVLTCLRGYRLPEPTRLAHELASHPEDDLSDLGPLFSR
jgi:deoxyribonuclease V